MTMAIYNASGTQLLSAYDASGIELATAYDASGDVVFSPEPYVPELTFLHSINMSVLNPDMVISPQGMAIYNGHIFQFSTNDEALHIIDMSDYSQVGSYEIAEFVHGNGLMFGNAVQQTGFPLLYASQWGTSESEESRNITIAQVGISSYGVDGYYEIPVSAGRHPQFVADWINGKAYTIGYSGSSTSSGNMIISAYDLNDMETVIDQWTVSYMGVLQGSTFWDKYIVIVGDFYNYAQVRITFINVETHEKTEFYFLKKQSTRMEFQGVDVVENNLIVSSWIYDAEDSNILKYWLYSVNLPSAGQSIES